MNRHAISAAFVTIVLGLKKQEQDIVRQRYEQRRLEISNLRKASAKKRKCNRRQSWMKFQNKLSDRQFRRYFRMTRECFTLLCERILSNVGHENFKSEQYLNEVRLGIITEKKKSNSFNAHQKSTGGFISGEVKLTLIL